MAPKVLVVLTSVGFIESANKPTGWYLPEFAHPHDVLTSKGAEIVVASPKGGASPLDPLSVELFKGDASASAFYQTQRALWEQTAPLASFRGRAGEFAALFFPGGHGPMFDLATDAESHALINEFVDAGKPVAAVCHGPAALANVVLTGPAATPGQTLLAGRRVTGFTDAEEAQVGMTQHMPFSLEARLAQAGGLFEKATEPWAPHVVVENGGKLITGQNPASSVGVGEAIAKAIGL
ncbi:DJ-1/PfpI family protein [Durotheca rogersii]|uniref:DJ-1/PfpI family protein n=1 Tax=Durotheca rogersii TaxID=419775 RepID=UPI0022208B7C|nr:DJ-1/PfpI family protein [Durotheca rogersii]KAI5863742.1 DJ-1/PfpI family protein [Durotheca rogersii]